MRNCLWLLHFAPGPAFVGLGRARLRAHGAPVHTLPEAGDALSPEMIGSVGRQAAM